MNNKFRRWRKTVEKIPYPALRIVVGVGMLIGGLLWFLPILGIWMIPLGIAVLAIDIPWMRPINRSMQRLIRRALDAMQRSRVSWISKLGHRLGTPISSKRVKSMLQSRKSPDSRRDADKALGVKNAVKNAVKKDADRLSDEAANDAKDKDEDVAEK